MSLRLAPALSSRIPSPQRALVLTAALWLLAGAANAQSASYTLFGQSCQGGTTPALAVQGLPRLGQTFRVDYVGHSGRGFIGQLSFDHHPILVTGASSTAVGGVPLPFAVPPGLTGGVPGCTLYVSLDVVTPMPLVTGGYLTSVPFAVPNVPALLGRSVFHQWLLLQTTFDMRTNVRTVRLQMSNAGHARIGT